MKPRWDTKRVNTNFGKWDCVVNIKRMENKIKDAKVRLRHTGPVRAGLRRKYDHEQIYMDITEYEAVLKMWQQRLEHTRGHL